MFVTGSLSTPILVAWAEQVMHSAVPLHEIPAAINGTVVGLSASGKPESGSPTIVHVLSGSAVDASPLECLGLGIVRAVDDASGSVFILSPVSASDMQRVDTLQACLRTNVSPPFVQSLCQRII